MLDDSHVTCKSVPNYCDVIDDNMAAPDCHHHRHHQPLYQHHYDQYHQHWTIAPPPPSYSSTNWRPLQPTAPRTDSAQRCDDVIVTSPPRVIRHAVVDSATVNNGSCCNNQDAMIVQSSLAHDCLLAPSPITTTTCPQCRRQTPACV